MRPDSIWTASGSPARIPNRRRKGPGRATWPLVDTFVCMVRQAYLLPAEANLINSWYWGRISARTSFLRRTGMTEFLIL